MTDLQFDTSYDEALNYESREAFISDLAISSLWDDPEGAPVPEERISNLGTIWDAAHMQIRELVTASSLSQAAFARAYHIPIRTVQDWIAGKRTPPEYVVWMVTKLMLSGK